MSNAHSATDDSRLPLNTDGPGRVARFLVSGAGATLLNLLLLWLLCGHWGVAYLPASVLAFSTALICNFAVQKVWTFGSSRADRVHTQLPQFFGANVLNLALNTAILFILVTRLSLPYLVAQVVSSALISANSYCAYRWIFQERK